MTLDRLWAGWRATYIDDVATRRRRRATSACSARLPHEDARRGGRSSARNDRVFAVMNAYPYTSGHLMVAPLRHEATLAALSADEAAALMAMTQDATAAVRAAYAPDGINVGVNIGRAAGAGVPGHVHVHVLPRWIGDTNFMTTRRRGARAPGAAAPSYEKLRAAWPA